METLNILKANALKAYNEANSNGKNLLTNLFGKEVFNQKITDRIKTFEDVLSVTNVTKEFFDSHTENLNKDEVAYCKLKLIAKALNEGWIPDWNNSGQYKYYPYFNMKDGFSYLFCVGYRRSDVGSRLCFKSSELAQFAGTQFLDIYKDYFIL